MSDLRWSFDSRTSELDVWDSEDGRIQHLDRHGREGFLYAAQGRIYPNFETNSALCMIYGNRPYSRDDGSEHDQLRQTAKEAVNYYLDAYGVEDREWVEIF